MLEQLGEETWGQRLRRAREASCLSVRATADRLAAAGFDVSYATISRLEDSETVPTGSRAIAACFVLLTYGFDPDDFGLADVRRLINIDVAVEALNPKVAEAVSAPRRRSSGRSPSAGSGSSPRRSGCSPRHFRKAA